MSWHSTASCSKQCTKCLCVTALCDTLQVRFFEVSEEQLVEQRKLFRDGQLPLKIEEETFDMAKYNAFVESVAEDTAAFKKKQQQAAVEQVLPQSQCCRSPALNLLGTACCC